MGGYLIKDAWQMLLKVWDERRAKRLSTAYPILHDENMKLLGQLSDLSTDLFRCQHRAKYLNNLLASSAHGETIVSVTTWANTTFGPATVYRQIERAREEFGKLTDLIKTPWGPDQIAEEAADVVICLYRVIGTLDPEAINKKMAKNRASKWSVGPDGCAQHVKE